jgi:hypothetical protein
MRTQAILLAVPSVAMTVVGFALFGPGSVRPFDGAQIWGGPTSGLRNVSLRIAVIERMRGVDSMHAVGGLVVRLAADGMDQTVRCRTRADATCDIDVDFGSAVKGRLAATVGTEDGQTLAEGELAGAPGWGAATREARIAGHANGELSVALYASRGVLAAPFRDELIVVVTRNGIAVPRARVDVQADGAELDGATPDGHAHIPAGEDGRARVGVKPLAHTLEVEVRADAGAATGSFTGVLPVVPGAMWLDPEGIREHKLRIVSPVARDVAYATLASPTERLWGGAIALLPDAQGFAQGAIDWPAVGPRTTVSASADASGPLWLTLSSDPRGSGGGTVGWPVPTPNAASAPLDERAFRDRLLLDGMPAAEHRDASRRGRARTLSAVALGAAAVLEAVLLGQTAGRPGGRSWAGLVVAIATIVLAFAAIEVVVMWKTSG